jgi:hypothetical protein
MATLLTRHWKLALLWALSLIAMGEITSSAQRGRPSFNFLTESTTIISGTDVGFRIERTQDGIPIGKLVVRVDGAWVDTAVSAAGR